MVSSTARTFSIGSPEITGLKPVANRNNLLIFGNGYAKNAIGPQWPLVFHESPGPSGWADAIVKVAKTKFKMKSVVLIAPNDQGGTDIASVDDSSPSTAIVTFSKPYADWKSLFGGGYGIYPSHLLQGKDRDALTKDGASQSTMGVTARNANGQPASGVGLRVTTVPGP